jgi:hypothetical protein
MPNVIDALKRLERIGSEHSETTRKIIDAAIELSEKIVSLYPPESGDCDIANNQQDVKDDEGWVRVVTLNPAGMIDETIPKMKYSISEVEDGPPGRAVSPGYRAVYNEIKRAPVYANRDVALQFASDIANGLLEYIERNLEASVAKNRDGVAPLEQAMAALSPRKGG